MNPKDNRANWLVLAYQFPKGPGAPRVKIWRRLQDLGSVAIKNSVYVLPNNDQSLEDFSWLLNELRSSGADGLILESQCLDGVDDNQIRQKFNSARNSEYRELVALIQNETNRKRGTENSDVEFVEARRTLGNAQKKLAEIKANDFFNAEQYGVAQDAVRKLDAQIQKHSIPLRDREQTLPDIELESLVGSVWVTRCGVGVDRIASAWLVRREIDSDARFKFVSKKKYAPKSGEIRFDMYDAEFTHVGDRCTFEVLVELTAKNDAALRLIGEIVHDIDLKDGKFCRTETGGVSRLLKGISARYDDDNLRLERGAELFENLYLSFTASNN